MQKINLMRSTITIILVCLCGLCLLWPGKTAVADAAADFSQADGGLEMVTTEADFIVRGEVIDATARWLPDRSAIVSDSRIRPHYMILGHTAILDEVVRPITVTLPGGAIESEEIAMVQSHVEWMRPGQQVILFLDEAEDGYRLVGEAYGRYILHDEGVQVSPLAEERTLADLYTTVGQIAAAQGKSLDLPADWAARESEVRAAGVLAPSDFVDTGQRWAGDSPVIDFYINVNTTQAGGNDGSAAEFLDNIEQASYTWSRIGDASISLRPLGSHNATTTAYNQFNEIVFSDDLGEGVLGMARVWYNPSTNIIAEADMAINTNYDFDATGTPDRDESDLQSVVLHEMGHWLSLGHDDDPASVMYPSLTTGTVKRELHPNDIEGVSTIYPCQSAPCIREWVPLLPVDTPDDPSQMVVEPGQATVHAFGEDEAPSIELAIPADAVTVSTTIDYAIMDAADVERAEGYEFSGYGFILSVSQQGQTVDDFTFNQAAQLDVFYDDTNLSAVEEGRLGLFTRMDGEWQTAGCGDYLHSPQSDQFTTSVCELGEFAIFIEPADPPPSGESYLYVPAIWRP